MTDLVHGRIGEVENVNVTAWAKRLGWYVVIAWSALYAFNIGSDFLLHPEKFFGDARLYYRATATWVAGGDPWAVSLGEIRFGGIPPTLLLNLPFLPFGEGAAVAFWPLAGALGMAVALNKLRLRLWWLFWPPVLEGWFPGSPDMALFAFTVLGVGAIAALTKPYSVPPMLADGRLHALAVAGAVGLVTIPLLPWGEFIANWPAISAALIEQSSDLSAWRSPVLMIMTISAIVSLGRPGLSLATPGIWPASQLHYATFSLPTAALSPILAFGLAIPQPAVGPLSIVAYALGVRLIVLRSKRLAKATESSDAA